MSLLDLFFAWRSAILTTMLLACSRLTAADVATKGTIELRLIYTRGVTGARSSSLFLFAE